MSYTRKKITRKSKFILDVNSVITTTTTTITTNRSKLHTFYVNINRFYGEYTMCMQNIYNTNTATSVVR